MPINITSPGTYIAETTVGVHTITGVPTSIAAFLGQATMGPVNQPVQCLSYADYTRTFGAPLASTTLAQSVSQFFRNGGATCYVVRVANGAQPAQLMLLSIAAQPVLQLTASSPGLWGAALTVTIDYDTPTPDSTFNLKVTYNGAQALIESFADLSMDPAAARYAPTYITQASQLLSASAPAATSAIPAGYSQAFLTVTTNGWNAALQSAWPTTDAAAFTISVDGRPWTTVNVSKSALAAAGPTDAATFAYLQTAINSALGPASATRVTIAADRSNRLTLTSSGSRKTSVQVRSAAASDLAQPLMLGVNQGGIEVARYADLRPVPNGIFLQGDANGLIATAIDALAAANLTDVTQATLNGTAKPLVLTAGGPTFSQGIPPATHDGVRQNLQCIAAFLNSSFPGYAASIAGYRISVLNLHPPSPAHIDTFNITAFGNAVIFAQQFAANTAAYSLSPTFSSPYSALVSPAPSDGIAPTQADYIGAQSARTGLYALDSVDLFNILVLPGDGIASEAEWQAIRSAAAAYCHSRRAFFVLDAPASWTSNQALTAQTSGVQSFRAALGSNSIDCAVYYSQVQINDNGTLRYVGPSGSIAGLYAATDESRGVWKAPAGIEAVLQGVTSLEVPLTTQQMDQLNPQGVNCLRTTPAGTVAWGARTVAGFNGSGSPDWTYVPVRRLALFLQESLDRGTRWAVFEPNNSDLWAQLRLDITNFFEKLFRQGAFQGTTPAQAFFVKCDADTTTQADIDAGVVNIVVGFAPLIPAEFVVLTIQQTAGTPSHPTDG